MSDEIQALNEKIERLQKKIDFYETDATTKGFYALNKIVNQQVDILNNFRLKDEISKNPKEDKTYDRVSDLWTKLGAMISSLNALKLELKISGDEAKDTKRVGFIEHFAEKRN